MAKRLQTADHQTHVLLLQTVVIKLEAHNLSRTSLYAVASYNFLSLELRNTSHFQHDIAPVHKAP